MSQAAAPLMRHLGVAIALKVIVLFVLWWAFVRDGRVPVDAELAAAHLGRPAEAAPSHLERQGEAP